MAAHTLRSLCRPPLGLLAARFSQRAAAETEYRSIYSLDKLYPPRQDGNAAAASAPEETQPATLDIPLARLTVSYCRSSGPGGQHVNKVNTKAEVRFHLASADWIPEAVRQKMALMHRNKINRAGELIVSSEESRYQMRNLAICLEKIRTMVTEATEKPKVVSKETTQKLIERVEKMNRERLRQKKIHSNIKQSRKADFD
ncbi:peptidyl-tRNA hydrolase ICT1, mitochondrial isoform X1 [Accipiter gentilis]|uniref:peptidyl-tRNA hydrolase ICT1, mitochondrial isoform X1 n=1 Tax=Astur gentilis TaxID=8957 RepID=UPI0021102A21|nr:peptidyl-tRNA hydrolase ICT1, mitochondrial isoform X1 [Accipiter gentilis]